MSPSSGANGTSVVTLTRMPSAKPSTAPSAIATPTLIARVYGRGIDYREARRRAQRTSGVAAINDQSLFRGRRTSGTYVATRRTRHGWIRTAAVRHSLEKRSTPTKGAPNGDRRAADLRGAGQPGSPVELKERYDNFIGGAWVPPTTGEYRANVSPGTGPAVLRGRVVGARGRRARARRRARRQGRLGARGRPPSAPRCSTPSRTRWRPTSRCSRSPRATRTASRCARRSPPTSRSRSTTSATSPARSAPRRAGSRRSTTRPTRTTSTSRSASSGRSSRSTSRC